MVIQEHVAIQERRDSLDLQVLKELQDPPRAQEQQESQEHRE
jgi:hypothetical protein